MKLFLLEILLFLCAEGGNYEMTVPTNGATIQQYSIYFSEKAHEQGFRDTVLAEMKDEGVVVVPAPELEEGAYPRPDQYNAEIRLFDQDGQMVSKRDTTFTVGYPSWITEQRFRDMIMILSPEYNGGYTFSHYQWYRNDEKLLGQNEPYLYLPEELSLDPAVTYSVGLIREGEQQEIRTCPLHVVKDKNDRPAPIYNYLSVVPTVVDRTNPVAYILCRYEGSYRIYTSTGTLITYGYFTPGQKNAYRLLLPTQPGVYIISMHAPSADYEKERTVRVVVQ